MTEIGIVDVISGQIPIVWGSGAKENVRTKMVIPCFAVPTGTTRYLRFDGHLVTCEANIHILHAVFGGVMSECN